MMKRRRSKMIAVLIMGSLKRYLSKMKRGVPSSTGEREYSRMSWLSVAQER